MTRWKTDPLLVAAKLLLILIGGVIGFAFIMLAIGTVAVLTVERADVMAQVAEFDGPQSLYWLVVAALIIIMAILAGIVRFNQLLYRMVTTVDHGDPFIPANTQRLEQMGWLTVGVQLGLTIIWGISQYVERFAGDTGIDGEITLSGWFLALVLFILARVFRHGTQLRAEVEGTI